MLRTEAVAFGLAVALLCATVALPSAAAPNSAAGAHHHDVAHVQLKRLVNDERRQHEKHERERAMRELQDALRTFAANPELALDEDYQMEDSIEHKEHADAAKRAFYSVQGKPRGKRTFYSVQGKPRGRRSANANELVASVVGDTQ